MRSNAGNISLTPYDRMFESTVPDKQQAGGEANNLPLDQLHPFKHHPFKLYNEEKMQEMVESIRQNGVLMPILVRPLEEGGFEIVSGHNRAEAAKQAGLTNIPANIREMDDETAIIVMVDSNLRQREKLLPSEKAFAYKMKLEAIKRKAGRPSLENSGQVDLNFSGKQSRDIIADETGDSGKQVARFIRLTDLVPHLIEMVDRLPFPYHYRGTQAVFPMPICRFMLNQSSSISIDRLALIHILCHDMDKAIPGVANL